MRYVDGLPVPTTPNYNGNITAQRWKSSLSPDRVRSYYYQYDGLNRLTNATYTAIDAQNQPKEQDWFNEKLTYDNNGNILTLKRTGLQSKNGTQMSFGLVDDFTYQYQGNQLLNIVNAVNTPTLHTGNEYNYMVGGVNGDYQYNANGSLLQDPRKSIDVIGYNHLNLPTFVCDTSGEKNYIINLYDAVGLKLRKRTLEDGKLKVQYDYISGNVYKDNVLEFVPTSEGRIIFENNKPVYEYHYKDHLGNLRVAFREAQSESWRATAELAHQSQEETQFANVNQTRANKPQYLGEKACETSQQKPLGWWKSIPVQKGDVIFATCDAFFERNTQNANTGINWNAFLFLNPNYALNNDENMMTPNNNLVGIGILPTFANNTPQIPKAYLVAQFYDENNVPKKQVIKYVTSANYSWNTLGEIQEIALENGRVEIFVANESNTKVYFDDLGIYKSPTPIVQENHYYPFGMNLVGIEKEGTPNHRFQYNGKEKEQSFGLNWLDYGARHYDSQVGRWFAVDALAEKYMEFSGYHYSGNNPQKFVEIDGNEFTEPMKRKVKELREQNNSYISGINERLKDKNLSETDRKTYNSLLSAHNAVNQEINDLEKSGTWYDYKEVNMGYSSEKKSGATFYNAKSGAVDVVIPQDSHIGLFAHELKHAHQFEIGTTSLQVYGGSHKGGIKPTDWQAYDITDEREAYARQELFKRPAPPNWEKEYIGKERDILHKDSKGKITNRIPFPQTSSDVNSVYNSYGGKAQELYTITRMNNSNMASKFQGKVIVSPQLSKIYKPKK